MKNLSKELLNSDLDLAIEEAECPIGFLSESIYYLKAYYRDVVHKKKSLDNNTFYRIMSLINKVEFLADAFKDVQREYKEFKIYIEDKDNS